MLAGCGIVERLLQSGAEFVDRGVETEAGIGGDVLPHGGGQGAKEFAIMRGWGLEVFGMIVRVLAGGESLGVVPPTRVRTDLVDGAAGILQKRAGDVACGVLARSERQHGLRVAREPLLQPVGFLRCELAPDVVGDQENFVRQHVHTQRTADRATRSAGERHLSFGDHPGVQIVEGGQGAASGRVEVLRREGAINVGDELVQRVVGHPRGT